MLNHVSSYNKYSTLLIKVILFSSLNEYRLISTACFYHSGRKEHKKIYTLKLNNYKLKTLQIQSYHIIYLHL
ncbi:hypothetical protein MNBD_GAMMA10-2494 [hydrothermal vent metagenome]|uniref:Uncharacterized protein n=1 Tax=hydrothermal vent metagenome TaxID=652676 RepID=A0A3B0YAY7_9ZZZZ